METPESVRLALQKGKWINSPMGSKINSLLSKSACSVHQSMSHRSAEGHTEKQVPSCCLHETGPVGPEKQVACVQDPGDYYSCL